MKNGLEEILKLLIIIEIYQQMTKNLEKIQNTSAVLKTTVTAFPSQKQLVTMLMCIVSSQYSHFIQHTIFK